MRRCHFTWNWTALLAFAIVTCKNIKMSYCVDSVQQNHPFPKQWILVPWIITYMYNTFWIVIRKYMYYASMSIPNTISTTYISTCACISSSSMKRFIVWNSLIQGHLQEWTFTLYTSYTHPNRETCKETRSLMTVNLTLKRSIARAIVLRGRGVWTLAWTYNKCIVDV